MLKSSGKIIYDPKRPVGMARGTDWWAIVKCDPEISRYYRWWVDKHVQNPLQLHKNGLCMPAHDTHISIVRGIKDVKKTLPQVKAAWKKYHLMDIEFEYEPIPVKVKDFWYINVECPFLTEIRKEMKLKTGYRFHITIGRTY